MRVVLLLPLLLALSLSTAFSQVADSAQAGYGFTMVKQMPFTSCKNQARTGTCWSFSTLSLLESEVLRMNKGEVNLSPMFIVRHDYPRKADRFVRMHGNASFAEGAEANDVLDIIREHGIVPEDVYTGKVIGEKEHNHGEMDAVLRGYIDAVVKNGNGRLSTAWKQGLAGILDAYLGAPPEKFTWKGKEWTPRGFADEGLGIRPDDYVLLTSFTHHPFYKPFVLEVPDNWSWGMMYNLPVDELMAVVDNALDNGFTVAWASDVSEKGFQYKKGVAVVPEKDWEDMSDKERESVGTGPAPEKTVTQEMRQAAFDNYATQDDHGMHIVGFAKDKTGAKFYFVKNSWGARNSAFNGFFYASVPYLRYKTVSVMVHKDALPSGIRKKLGF